jgi:hypothetical protein
MINFPDSPTIGQIFTSAGESWKWDGTKWEASTTAGSQAVATVTIGSSPPTNPLVGNLWWDAVGGQLYLWYDDGTSKQWVVANNPMLAGYLALAGGTMQGALTLAADPIVPLQAVTKQYTDKMLPLAGGTMTGDLNIAELNPSINLKISGSGHYAQIATTSGAKTRWVFAPGDGTPETGTNTGSNLAINRFDDFGVYLGTPLNINRATGVVTINSNYSSVFDAKGNLGIGITPPVNQTTAVTSNGGGWMFGWGITINNWGNNGYYDGTNWRYKNAGVMWNQQMTGGSWILQYAPSGAADAIASPATVLTVDSGGNADFAGHLQSEGGGRIVGDLTVGQLVSDWWYGGGFSWGWDGYGAKVAVNRGDEGYDIFAMPWGYPWVPFYNMDFHQGNSNMYLWWPGSGVNWAVTWSDRRLKSNIIQATVDGLEAVNQLRLWEFDLTPPFADAVAQHRRCGLIADEVEKVIPDAYIAPVSAPNGDQTYASLNELPLICTLVRAVQQLTDRVKVLEAHHART